MLQSYAKKSTDSIIEHKYTVMYLLGTILLLAVIPSILNGLFAFLLTGHLPGTDLVVPYWVMFTVYVGALLMIMLLIIEDMFFTHEAVRKHAAKRRAPRRPYNHS